MVVFLFVRIIWTNNYIFEAMEEIRLTVSEELHAKIFDILDFECQKAPEFIKPIINQILEDYSEDEIKESISKNKKEIRLRGVSPTKYKRLQSISDHLGISIGQLIRLRLQKTADEHPVLGVG